jgi:hypothetical protein
LPAPVGYSVLSAPGSTNGPITPADFDKNAGDGAAASTHFLHGYDITYESNFTDEEVEATVFTFASPADAAGFEPVIVGTGNANDQSPVRSTLPSIPGSVMLTATKPDSDGFYVIDVVAVKGDTVMIIEYSNDAALQGVPDVLNTSATQQYVRLGPAAPAPTGSRPSSLQ